MIAFKANYPRNAKLYNFPKKKEPHFQFFCLEVSMKRQILLNYEFICFAFKDVVILVFI